MFSLTNYLLVLISFLGLPLGVILYHLTKEEYKLGKKYFKLIKTATLSIILIYLLTILLTTLIDTISVIFGILLTILGYYLTKKFKILELPSLSLMLALNIDKVLFPSLIFIYNLAKGTLENNKKLIIPFFLFIIPFLIISLIEKDLNPYIIYYSIGSLVSLIKDNI